MKKNILFYVIFSLALALGFSACSLSLAQDVTPPPGYQPPVYQEAELLTGMFPEVVPDPAAGAEIYQEKCLPCHGDTGLGNGPDSTGLPVEVAAIGSAQLANTASPLKWFSITTEGNIEQFMPPFSGSLDPEDVWDVLSYVYTLGDAPEKVTVGEEIFANICAECHGGDGSGAVPGAADLTDAEYMVELSINDIVQQVSTGNGNQDHVFATVLDAEQQESVAYYVRSLIFPQEGEAPEAVAEAEPSEEDVEADAAEETPVEEPQAEEPADATPAPEDDAGDMDIISLGVVTGEVINGSGGDLPEGLEVTLEGYQHFEKVFEISAPVQEDGSYIFEGVLIEPEQIYIAVVELDGLFYPSDFYIAEEGDTGFELPVTIYDTTTDTENLAVSRLHVFFQFTDEGTIQVIHQVSISNRGSQMVAPGEDNTPVLNFILPDGAQNLIFEQGAIGSPYVETSTGFGDPSAVLPGESTYELLFAYELPYDRSLEWQLPVDLPTDVAVMFVQGDQVKVDSSMLMPSGTEALDTEIFQVFVGDSLAAGETIDVEISGRVSGAADGGFGENNWLVIAAGVLGVALAVFGAWQFFRPAADDDQYVEAEDDFGSDSESIMDEIVALDLAFEAGELEQDVYQKRRNELKAALKSALAQEEAN